MYVQALFAIYFIATFQLAAGSSRSIQCLTACELDDVLMTDQTIGQIDLACPQNKTITIISALYGRLDSETCPQSLTFINPLYTTVCKAAKAKDKVDALCNGKESCTVKANNQVFGNPCPMTTKYLTVCYTCTGITQSQPSPEKKETTAKTSSPGSDQETKEGSFTITYSMGLIIGVSVTSLIVASAITWCWCTRDKKGAATNSKEEDPGVFIIKDKDGKVLSDEYIQSCCGILLDRESSSGQFLAQLKRYHGTEIIERVEDNEEYGYAYGLQDYEPGEIVDYNVGYHAAGDSDSDGESVAEIKDANAMYGRASTST